MHESGLTGPSLLVLASAIALDVVFGDAPNVGHPVAWLGRAIGAMRSGLPTEGTRAPFLAGIGLVLASILLATAVTSCGVIGATCVHPWVGFVAAVFFTKSTFALRGLTGAATALVRTYRDQGLDAARGRLSWLCSRDASRLDESGLANGTIESLAENLSDSVVAPLCFYLCFGLLGAVVYRVLNTLDAMVGYRGRYEWLGKASARLDDVANLLPARITALLLALSGGVLQMPVDRGVATYRADRRRTESPNAGHPMSMAAGLLGLRLDKPGVYVLGAAFAPPALDDVSRATRLVWVAGALAFAFSIIGAFARG